MILTLALSIGANSAIFSVIHGVLIRSLPYPNPDRIVRFFLSNAGFPKFPINAFDFLDFRARNRSFGSMAIMTRSDMQLSGAGEPQRLTGFRVSAGYFRVLGLAPARGREFDTSDELPGHERIAILSDRLWRARFNADPDILGRKMILEGLPFTVVGVMPPQMQHPGNEYRAVPYGDTVDLWWPFTFQGNPNRRGSHYIEGIGRLKNGVTPEEADAEMNAIMAQLAREHPDNDSGWRVLVIPLYREIVGSRQRMLLVLLGAVGLVLLIACANAANLLLARATSRRREMAVRLALGAARVRLIRQMLTESLVISVAGGVAGASIAIFGVKSLVALLPAGFPRSHEIHVNLAVLVFTLAIALGAGILFGLAPALQSSRTDVHQNLREGGRGATPSARQLLLRNWLVVSEVSLACVLLIGAGLLLRSFVNILRTNPGFNGEHVLTMGMSLPRETYKTPASTTRFYEQLLDKLTSLPGVHAVGIGSDLPWTGYDDNTSFEIEGRQDRTVEIHARYHAASPDYFRALGVPLLAGRFLIAADSAAGSQVVVVNQAMAQRYWPGENVLGRRINFFSDPKNKRWTTIVGVVGDVKDAPEKEAAEPAFWWPMPVTPYGFPGMMIAIRANSNPASLVAAVRGCIREIDPTLAIADVRLMDEIADASFSTPRFTVFLVGLFALLAITLAAIGAYGVISYSVNQRTHEFGMRTALGARSSDVMRLVLAQGAKLAIGGVAIGILFALAFTRVLRSLLYEVSAVDPLTFAVVSLIAPAVATLACYLPARRATQVDPAVALRAE
jgi:predicted permease